MIRNWIKPMFMFLGVNVIAECSPAAGLLSMCYYAHQAGQAHRARLLWSPDNTYIDVGLYGYDEIPFDNAVDLDRFLLRRLMWCVMTITCIFFRMREAMRNDFYLVGYRP